MEKRCRYCVWAGKMGYTFFCEKFYNRFGKERANEINNCVFYEPSEVDVFELLKRNKEY